MYTIFLQGADRGVGMGYDEFVEEFEHICSEHVKNGKARAFAFIFYDMLNGTVRNALRQERGFEILNNASGKEITLFYLHSDALTTRAKEFNERFLVTLNSEHQIHPPCIVFFRIHGADIEDIAFHSIDAQTREPHLVVEELRRYISGYIDEMNAQGDLTGLTWLGKTGLVGILRAVLRS
jgi:hypothetical protein